MSTTLAKAFQDHNKARFKLGGQSYEVDFASAEPKQKNVQTQFERDIRRVAVSGPAQKRAPPPKTWTPQSESQHCTLVPVGSGSSEWAAVESQMIVTMPTARLKQLERIQNVHLWEYYCSSKALMTNRAGGKDPNVVSVWHGTSSANDPKLIYEDVQDGFMMQHCTAECGAAASTGGLICGRARVQFDHDKRLSGLKSEPYR